MQSTHPAECTCGECVLGRGDMIVDLTSAVNTGSVYALNEKEIGSCQKIFKGKGNIKDKTTWCESNDGDTDLLIYIPFSSQVKLRSMTMVGGEDGTSPAKVKLFVNKENPDFELAEEKATQELDCVENPEGELPYMLSPSKFSVTWSITLLVTLNHGADNTKIYGISFEGISTNKKRKILIGNYELRPIPGAVNPPQQENTHSEMIYG